MIMSSIKNPSVGPSEMARPSHIVGFHLLAVIASREILKMEKWKPVVGYKGYYEVSSLGRVRSLSCIKKGCWGSSYKKKGRILKPAPIKGYRTVTLSVNSKHKTIKVSRLVAFAFHGKPPKGKPYALHNDNNSLNDCAKNIRWGSPQDNMDDKVRAGNHCGENVGNKLKESDVIEIRKMIDKGIKQIDIANKFGVNQTQISKIKLRKSWKHI
jgi:hypothetical protein